MRMIVEGTGQVDQFSLVGRRILMLKSRGVQEGMVQG